jgi:hypothetical protein
MQLIVHARSIEGGILFDVKEQLSPHVVEPLNATFKRLMGDGTFSRPQEVLEWVPDGGRPIVYKVQGVVHCQGIEQLAPAHHGRCARLSTLFSLFTTSSSPPQLPR